MFKGSYSGNYATIEREENSEVPVLLWKISAQDEKIYWRKNFRNRLHNARRKKTRIADRILLQRTARRLQKISF